MPRVTWSCVVGFSCCGDGFVSSFELDGCEHAERRLAAPLQPGCTGPPQTKSGRRPIPMYGCPPTGSPSLTSYPTPGASKPSGPRSTGKLFNEQIAVPDHAIQRYVTATIFILTKTADRLADILEQTAGRHRRLGVRPVRREHHLH